MAINKVDLTVSQLITDLNDGMTWLKKDDLGYGSIEVKYGANEKQIAAIRKHPALKDVETTVTIFNIIDDTKQEKIEQPTVVKDETPVVDAQVTSKDTSSKEEKQAADVFNSL